MDYSWLHRLWLRHDRSYSTFAAFVSVLYAYLFAFAKSSDRLHKWFISTELYKKNLESFVNKKGMTVKTKIRIVACVTLVMAFGFIMMKHVPVGRIVLAIVWVGHVLYFIFGIKTLEEERQTTEVLEIEGGEND